MSEKTDGICVGDNGRYRLMLGGDKNFGFLPTEEYAMAQDTLNGSTVLLHMFSEYADAATEPREAFMYEADAASALEELTGGGCFALPLLLDDCFFSECPENGLRTACLVYSVPSDSLPLEKFLSSANATHERLCEILEKVRNTVLRAEYSGIYHGNLDARHILVGKRGEVRIWGYGARANALAADDEAAIGELARSMLKHAAPSGNGKSDREAKCRLLRMATENFHAAPKKRAKISAYSAARLACLVLCAVTVISAYAAVANVFGGKYDVKDVATPRLVGYVFREYDTGGNVYVFDDPKSGERLLLDANIYSVTCDTTDDYYIYREDGSSFGSSGIAYSDAVSELGEIESGTVVRQYPDAGAALRIQTGHTRADIKITLQSGRARLAVKVSELLGTDEASAGEKLASVNAKYRVGIRYNRRIPKGTVYSVLDGNGQTPENVAYGDEVLLLVSGGEKQ